MSRTKSEFPPDKTESERRKNLSRRDIKDLELAGGVEGGMQAGSVGGPGADESRADRRSSDETSSSD